MESPIREATVQVNGRDNRETPDPTTMPFNHRIL